MCRLRPLGVAACVVFSACVGEAADSDAMAFPTHALENGIPLSLETEDTLPSALKTIEVEAVQGRTGPGGDTFYVARRAAEGVRYLSRQIGQRTFPLGLRINYADLSQYPCTSCHQGQEIIGDGVDRDREGVHHNIQPEHPEETGALCTTCHSADAIGRLTLERGGTTSIDHVYRLCAQCHFPEVTSWANGSHGKRLVGWRGRRVVMGCTDCHNPHQPGTEERIPYPGRARPGKLTGERHD